MDFWNNEPRDIWEILKLDNSDLAVILACDLTEGLINPCDYLIYTDDFERMTLVRFCLLLHAKPESLADLSNDELYTLRDKLLKEMFDFFDPSNEHRRRFLLQVIQKPISIWGIGCLHITHCSCEICMDMDVMRERLKQHLQFELYRPYITRDPIVAPIVTEYDWEK